MDRCGDGSAENGLLKGRCPPVQIRGDTLVGRLGDVGIVVAGREHGFKAGEVGATAWDDMAGMEQFAVQFLDVVENVCGTCPPFRDRVGIFGLL